MVQMSVQILGEIPHHELVIAVAVRADKFMDLSGTIINRIVIHFWPSECQNLVSASRLASSSSLSHVSYFA